MQSFVGDMVEQLNGVLIDFFPDFGVQAAEQIQSFLVPAEPKVMCQLIERLQFGGNMAFYGDRLPRGLIRIGDFNVHGVSMFCSLIQLR